MAEAHRAAERLIHDPRWWFTVMGPFGVGKTGLLAAIINAGRAAGKVSVYATTADMLDHLRASYAPEAPLGYDERMELYKTADILALDEMDRWHSTSWAEEKFFQVMEARYENGPRQLTVLALNGRLEELPGYLRSRIEDRRCQVHILPAGDIRKAPRRAEPAEHYTDK